MTRSTPTSPLAYLLPGFRSEGPPLHERAEAARGRMRERGEARAARLGIAEPPTHDPMGEAERRAYHAAARAERQRWAAVLEKPHPQHLLPAAVTMLSDTPGTAESINATLAEFARISHNPPSAAIPSPKNGRERLEARVAAHRASVAQQEPAEPGDADFARSVSAALAKVRHPDAPPTNKSRS